MERSLIIACIMVLFTTMAPACHGYSSDGGLYAPPPRQVTYLRFFLHDTLSGPNPTAVMATRPYTSTSFSDSPLPFGSVYVTADKLTVGPELTSGVIGDAQGLWASTGQDDISIVTYMDFGFTEGKYSGSSISVFSRNLITQGEREVAVVGGRGKFRMATGFANLKTYFMDVTTGDAIVEYNVTVIHY